MAGLDITYFISTELWSEYGFTDTNTDVKKLLPIIAKVQRINIKPVIGSTLFDKLVSDVKANTLSGLYLELMKYHIQPTMIVFCDMEATFHTTYQITNKTTGENRDENIQPNDLNKNNDLRTNLMKGAQAHVRDMQAFLCDNWELIPELNQAVDSEVLAQTIRPHIKPQNDFGGFISII
jgi:hypothetical protein